jgi:hypothetical protein
LACFYHGYPRLKKGPDTFNKHSLNVSPPFSN